MPGSESDSETSNDSWSIVDSAGEPTRQLRLEDYEDDGDVSLHSTDVDDDVDYSEDDDDDICLEQDESDIDQHDDKESDMDSDLEEKTDEDEEEKLSSSDEAERMNEEDDDEEERDTECEESAEEEEEEEEVEDVDDDEKEDEVDDDEMCIVDEDEEETTEGAAKYFVSPACIPQRIADLSEDLEDNDMLVTVLSASVRPLLFASVFLVTLPLNLALLADLLHGSRRMAPPTYPVISPQRWSSDDLLAVDVFAAPSRGQEQSTKWSPAMYCWFVDNTTKVELTPSWNKPRSRVVKRRRSLKMCSKEHRNFSSVTLPSPFVKAATFQPPKASDEELWQVWSKMFDALTTLPKSTAISPIHMPKSLRPVPRPSNPQQQPCFEKHMPFAPCRTQRNWPSVVKSTPFDEMFVPKNNYLEKKKASKTDILRQPFNAVNARKASESMRLKKFHQQQCNRKAQIAPTDTRASRPCLQYKQPLPCRPADYDKNAKLEKAKFGRKFEQKASRDWFTERSRTRANLRRA